MKITTFLCNIAIYNLFRIKLSQQVKLHNNMVKKYIQNPCC